MSRPSPETFAHLAPFLIELRRFPALTEKNEGLFYMGSKAFLHFHGAPGDIVADLKTTGDWERYPVNNRTDQKKVLKAMTAYLDRRAKSKTERKREIA